MSQLTASPTKESEFSCETCGLAGRRVWGEVIGQSDQTLAIYYVTWVAACPTDFPQFDLVIGEWGDGTSSADRILISAEFNVTESGPAFRIVDANPDFYRSLAVRSLKREEVIGTFHADKTFELLDVIWVEDPRIHDMYQDVLNRSHPH